jgi:DNA-directed RNA polymerase subunit RPC12/RpoP
MNIQCPWCKSTRLEESSALHATMIKVKNPGRTPLEVRVKIYTCLDCEREFTEREAKFNNHGGEGSPPKK